MLIAAGIIILLIPVGAYILMIQRGWHENPISDDPDQYTRLVTQKVRPFLRPLYVAPKLFRRRRRKTQAKPVSQMGGNALAETGRPEHES